MAKRRERENRRRNARFGLLKARVAVLASIDWFVYGSMSVTHIIHRIRGLVDTSVRNTGNISRMGRQTASELGRQLPDMMQVRRMH